MSYEKLQEEAKDELKALNKLNFRLHKDNLGREESRDPYQRDFTRILYSSSFRRLQGKMQLLGVQNENFFRNRLTHSLEVAQISRAIAENIGYESTYTPEASALAHDIGNPPFGHHGEKILNMLAKDFGGFEGNAQTLRVLMRIEKKNPDTHGLNLTLRTLLSVCKYIKNRHSKNKKFMYDDDYERLSQEIVQNAIEVRTLDVQIMDLADEIAYAAHDLEDSLSLKLFTIDELLYEYGKCSKSSKSPDAAGYAKFEEIIQDSKKIARIGCNFNSSEEYAFLFKKEILGNIVHTLIKDISFIDVNENMRKKTGTKRRRELSFENYGQMSETLKKLTFNCVKRTDAVRIYEKKGETILKSLFELYADKQFNENYELLPPEYRPQDSDDENSINRYIIDYISGMMDSYAIATYKKFFGSRELDRIYQNFHVHT